MMHQTPLPRAVRIAALVLVLCNCLMTFSFASPPGIFSSGCASVAEISAWGSISPACTTLSEGADGVWCAGTAALFIHFQCSQPRQYWSFEYENMHTVVSTDNRVWMDTCSSSTTTTSCSSPLPSSTLSTFGAKASINYECQGTEIVRLAEQFSIICLRRAQFTFLDSVSQQMTTTPPPLSRPADGMISLPAGGGGGVVASDAVTWCGNIPEVCGIKTPAITFSLPSGFPALRSGSTDVFKDFPVQGFVDDVKNKVISAAEDACTVVPFYTSEYINKLSDDTAPVWFKLFPSSLRGPMVSACGKLSEVLPDDEPNKGYLMVAGAIPIGGETRAACLATVWCDKEFLIGFDGMKVAIPIVPEVLAVTVGLHFVAWATEGLPPATLKIWECMLANSGDASARFGREIDVVMTPNLAIGGFLEFGLDMPTSKPVVKLGIVSEARLYVDMDPAGTGIGVGADHEVGFTADAKPRLTIVDPATDKDILAFDGPLTMFGIYWKYLNDQSFTVALRLERSWSLQDLLKSLEIKGFDIGGKLADILSVDDLKVMTTFNMFVRRSAEGLFWGVRMILGADIRVNDKLAKLLNIGTGATLQFGFVVGSEPRQITSLTLLYGTARDRLNYYAVPQLEVGQGTCVVNMMCKSNRCCQSQGGVCAAREDDNGCCANNGSPALFTCPQSRPYCYNDGDRPTYTCYTKQPDGAGCAVSGNNGCASGLCCNNPLTTRSALLGKCYTGSCGYLNGDLCANNDQCASRLCCNNPVNSDPSKLGKCVAQSETCLRNDGAGCTLNSQCKSDLCCNNPVNSAPDKLGKCISKAETCLRNDGAGCTLNSQCRSDLCCNNYFRSSSRKYNKCASGNCN